MFAFVGTVGVSEAGYGSEGRQGREVATAVLAGVSGFLASFVEGVLALVRSGGMTQAAAAAE
jgi:hypothetical protein